MTALPSGYERRYRPRGGIAHAVSIITTPASNDPNRNRAACQLNPPWDGWRGTGSQAEREHAAGLPLCTGCDQALGGAS